MMPVYRPPAGYFRQALESVLLQDPGPDRMEITVVDDASPDGEVGALVQAIAGDRVAYVRNPHNLGLAACWNECIRLARGRWIHLLHQDDYVFPGFYETLEQAARAHPEVNLLAARTHYVDGQGATIGYSDRLPELESGGHDVHAFFYTTPIQCPGVAIQKSFFARHGGFRTDMSFVLDCEMWARAIHLGGGLVRPEVLSAYRINEGNVSSRLARTAADLADYDRLHRLFTRRYHGFDAQRARDLIIAKAQKREREFAQKGDPAAALANRKFWRRQLSMAEHLARFLKKFMGSRPPEYKP